MGDKLKHYTVDSWHSVLFYVVPAVFFEDCSKHGAGERSTQDQTSCLLREQYIASTQVLCRKSFRVGTSEQYLYHISLQKRMKREEKGQLKLGFKKKKKIRFCLCCYTSPCLSESVGWRFLLGILNTVGKK